MGSALRGATPSPPSPPVVPADILARTAHHSVALACEVQADVVEVGSVAAWLASLSVREPPPLSSAVSAARADGLVACAWSVPDSVLRVLGGRASAVAGLSSARLFEMDGAADLVDVDGRPLGGNPNSWVLEVYREVRPVRSRLAWSPSAARWLLINLEPIFDSHEEDAPPALVFGTSREVRMKRRPPSGALRPIAGGEGPSATLRIIHEERSVGREGLGTTFRLVTTDGSGTREREVSIPDPEPDGGEGLPS